MPPNTNYLDGESALKASGTMSCGRAGYVCVTVSAFVTYLPGYISMVPGVALQVAAAQLQLLLQLLPQFL